MNVEHHGFLGICSCLLMQERLEALQPEWDTTVYKQARLEGREVPVLKVRCGLHTSPAYIGNMGSPSRMKYGASGGACTGGVTRVQMVVVPYQQCVVCHRRFVHRCDAGGNEQALWHAHSRFGEHL